MNIKVKCIKGAHHSLKSKVEVGETYYAEDFGSYYYIIDGVSWAKNRFVVVSDTIPAPPPTVPSAAPRLRSAMLSRTDADTEEERLRALLKPARLPGDCACGCVKMLCPYHKDT